MLKNSLNQTVLYFIVSLIITSSVNGQIDTDSIGFSFMGGNSEEFSSQQESSMDQSPIIDAVSFTNTDITDIFQIINARTQWSIFPTDKVSKTKISFYAQDITAKNLLDTIVKMSGFIYHQDGNIITVMTYEEYAQFFGLSKKVVTLKYGEADSIATVIKAYQSQLGESVVHVETNSIVIYETEASLETILKIIEELDVITETGSVIKVLDIVYMDVEELANTLQSMFGQDKNERRNSKTRNDKNDKKITDERISSSEVFGDDVFSIPNSEEIGVYTLSSSNKLIVKAPRKIMEEIEKLVETLDIFMEPITKTYQLTYIDAADIYQDLENILDIRTGSSLYGGRSSRTGGISSRSQGNRPGGLTLIEKTNSILVTGQPSVHRVMESIIKEVDVRSNYETGQIQIYKIDNADIEEIAGVVKELLETKQTKEDGTGESKFINQSPKDNINTNEAIGIAETEEYIPQIEARIAVSSSTNSIIIRATARQHHELGMLIDKLDERRDQVEVQAMIVEVSTNEDLDFGVELDDFQGETFAFTSFGLSTIDPSTGLREVVASPGGTAAVLHPHTVQAIIHALQGNDNIRIESQPRLLVNDNAVGAIESVAEQPTRQINQGQTTTTTSFGEYVTAGTQFYVTPHISDDSKYLRLEYQLLLNSFGEQADPELPPTRNTSKIQGETTVPNGSTIILGGIQSKQETESIDKVPFIGDIPFIGLLFKKTAIRKQYITSYLFVTTTVFENEDFGDLIKVSDKALNEVNKNDREEQNIETENMQE